MEGPEGPRPTAMCINIICVKSLTYHAHFPFRLFLRLPLVLTGAYSVLPPVPGMGYQPMVKAEETLLTYSMANTKEGKKTRKPYKEGLQNFLETGAKPDRVAPAIKGRLDR